MSGDQPGWLSCHQSRSRHQGSCRVVSQCDDACLATDLITGEDAFLTILGDNGEVTVHVDRLGTLGDERIRDVQVDGVKPMP